jgi:hypothetical protein
MPSSLARRESGRVTGEANALVSTQAAGRDDEEIAVTRRIATAKRERAGEINADEILREDRPNDRNELSQEIVELRKPSCGRRSALSFVTIAQATARFADDAFSRSRSA